MCEESGEDEWEEFNRSQSDSSNPLLSPSSLDQATLVLTSSISLEDQQRSPLESLTHSGSFAKASKKAKKTGGAKKKKKLTHHEKFGKKKTNKYYLHKIEETHNSAESEEEENSGNQKKDSQMMQQAA